MMNLLSNLLIPSLVLIIIVYGLYKKINLYDNFIEGAKESFEIVLSIFPNLLAMILAINIFLNSDVIGLVLEKIKDYIKFPTEIIYLSMIRPISGSSSIAILNRIFEKFNPDTFIGTLASVIQGANDTTLYVLTLYFGSVGIKKIKYALWLSLLTDLFAIIISFFLVSIIF
ncbi:MAG TPA: spore maturation protein [Tenericutes bacterium]|nr:spore maturation protein [Mycoplasmatota bacterium]